MNQVESEAGLAMGAATGVMISKMELESKIMPSSSTIPMYKVRKP
jgi:hypothetical protein